MNIAATFLLWLYFFCLLKRFHIFIFIGIYGKISEVIGFGCGVTAINPIFHALTSENPKEYNHIIALMYNSNNVLCVEPEEFDLTSYLADAEREAEQKIAMLERDEIERMKNGG